MLVDNRMQGTVSESSRVSLSFFSNSWHAAWGESFLEAPFDLVIKSASRKKYITLQLAGEKRRYPLPLYIRSRNGEPRFLVRESLKRYACDSALAEYGIRSPEESEAVHALGQVIAARARFRKRGRVHKDFDFCDLTHCQVYRGKLLPGSRERFWADDWRIDAGKLSDELLFHSSCGGETLDKRVFGPYKGQFAPVLDKLYREGTILCRSSRSPHSFWERTIALSELLNILAKRRNFAANRQLDGERDLEPVSFISGEGMAAVPGDEAANNFLKEISLRYTHPGQKIVIGDSDNKQNIQKIPAESFRLALNRKKGWNFIKSNNYSLSMESLSGKRIVRFKGSGLGHGVGLCQHGALALARKGYNRFEILEHYYPRISFTDLPQERAPGRRLSPYLSFLLFDITTGAVEPGSSSALLNREVPPGSFWKLVVSLYCAAERPDLFKDYHFRCPGDIVTDPKLPDRCWYPQGHGMIDLRKALPHSCNLYFASLYRHIRYERFKTFYNSLRKKLNIKSPLPPIKSDRDWAHLLSGLNFRYSLTLGNCIALAGCVHPETHSNSAIKQVQALVPEEFRTAIFKALMNTVISGTGKWSEKKDYGNSKNFRYLKRPGIKEMATRHRQGLWGKTSTVIDGTNKPLCYGMFLGGIGSRGIIVVLRKGNGNTAAQWGKILLEGEGSMLRLRSAQGFQVQD
ncbi:MAG: hypothetical protein GY754_46630 [bacterium]|nr:hypothetical protein [bacterium]